MEASPPSPPPPLREYELPTARRVVTYGLQLAYRSSSELRRASLYIGVLTLALLGPPLVFAVEFVARFQLVSLDALTSLFSDTAVIASFVTLVFVFYGALFGWLAVGIDGGLIAVALLAARASDRPFSLREATIRARQVFWRMIRGSLVAGIVSGVVQLVVSALLVALLGRSDAGGVVVTVVSVFFLAPLGYLATGVVIGDVGAVEALKRSVRLARARPRIALVVALFTLVTAAVQTFALFAGLDLFIRVGSFLNVGVTGGVLPLVLTLLGLLAFVMAFGSLTFTVAAIVAAPQVAAFLGLTFYAAGLDRVRDVQAGAPRFRWVTRPMVALIVLVGLASGLGIASMPSAGATGSDPLVRLLRDGANGRSLVYAFGDPLELQDPTGDEVGTAIPAADVVAQRAAVLESVPDWVLNEMFDCDRPEVACAAIPGPSGEFARGALLVLEQLAGPPVDLDPGAITDWGPIFEFPGSVAAPARYGAFAAATDVYETRLTSSGRSMRLLTFRNGRGFIEIATAARSVSLGDSLLTLIPLPLSFAADPLAWDAYASYWSPGAHAGEFQDTIRRAGTSLLPFGSPQFISLIDSPFASIR